MIQSKTDLKYYIIQDKKMNGIIEKSFSSKIKNTLFPDLTLKYLRFLRKSEYYYNNNCIVQYWYRYRLRKMGLKLGYSIPINVFGPGLSIPHRGTIVVNSKARIGANCRLHVCVNIGASGGNPNAPQIGNNVYIGPGAILFGDITIADNVTVGANATVNSSCEQQNVVLAGSPAKIVKEGYPCWLEFNDISL
jgi:serine O-acetyltransferase